MTIHLRTVTDGNGDTLDHLWYCSRFCYLDSFAHDVTDEDEVERGGAYPCGAENDYPDFCATCGAPVGNPLTDEGVAYLRELLDDWHGDEAVREALEDEYRWSLEAAS